MAAAVNWNNVPMLTKGMKNLGNQFNSAFPGRDGASDGAIGDYAHTQEDSGHNPDDTSQHNAEWDGDADNVKDVRAIDVDSDLRTPGVTMQDVIDHLRALPGLSSVLRYMIFNRKIYSASNGWVPQTYSGASAHTEHAHFSGAYTEASDQNGTFDFKFDEIGDDMTPDQMIAALKTAEGREALRQPMTEEAYGPSASRVSLSGYLAESNLNDDKIPGIIAEQARQGALLDKIAAKLEVPVAVLDKAAPPAVKK